MGTLAGSLIDYCWGGGCQCLVNDSLTWDVDGAVALREVLVWCGGRGVRLASWGLTQCAGAQCPRSGGIATPLPNGLLFMIGVWQLHHDLRRLRIGLAQIRPGFGQVRPDLARIRPSLLELGQTWPRFGRTWLELCQIPPALARSRPNMARCRRSLSWNRQIIARFRPTRLAKLCAQS